LIFRINQFTDESGTMTITIQLIEQLVPFFFILLGFVLLAISIWGIVIYLRQPPSLQQKDQTDQVKIT
jgi:hypothetical protein